MSNDVTLAQLAADMAHLRRQLEMVNQRLDMIYGAVTRLAETRTSAASPAVQGEQTQTAPPPATGIPLTPQMMLDPGSMLDSLRQYAVSMGLDVSPETVERLKSPPAEDKTKDEPK